MITDKSKIKGFTLIEMLLALVVAASVVMMIVSYTTQKADELRRDRASMQMQQILNAALSYYVNNSSWPADAVGAFPASLQTDGFLPAGTFNNPWGNGFTVAAWTANPAGGNYDNTTSPKYGISTTFPTTAEATIVAGRLPFAVAAAKTVTAYVSVPVQKLNNDRSVNFAQVYNSGACVPAPTCPLGMTLTIYVVPVQVYGQYQAPAAGTQTLSPLTGYTAYAIGPGGQAALQACDGSGVETCQETTGTNMPTANNPAGQYYRVCLAVETNLGSVSPTTNTWGVAMGSVLAITRCQPGGEQTGTQFNVWSQ